METSADRIAGKISALNDLITELKESERESRRKIYSIELSLTQARAAAVELDDVKRKFNRIVEERDRLRMERSLLKKKIEKVLRRLDGALESIGADARSARA